MGRKSVIGVGLSPGRKRRRRKCEPCVYLDCRKIDSCTGITMFTPVSGARHGCPLCIPLENARSSKGILLSRLMAVSCGTEGCDCIRAMPRGLVSRLLVGMGMVFRGGRGVI